MPRLLLFGVGNAGWRYYKIFTALGCDVDCVDPYEYEDGPSIKYRDYFYVRDFSKYDAFLVCTGSHKRYFIPSLLSMQKPILVEKPLTYPGGGTYQNEYISSENLFVGLQMPFMPSYQQFIKDVVAGATEELQDAWIISLVAYSNWEKWVGLRGPHKDVLLPQFEFIHDVDLVFRLVRQLTDSYNPTRCVKWGGDPLKWYFGSTDSVGSVTAELSLSPVDDTEIREITCIHPDAVTNTTFMLDRHENDQAYVQQAQAFLAVVAGEEVSPHLTTAAHWFELLEFIGES